MMEERPVFLSNAEAEQKRASGTLFVDAFTRQLKELFFIENPEFIGSDKQSVFNSSDFAAYAQRKSADFVHVYLPWNSTLIKTVGADDYFRLKTNRNQDLITASEQQKLYSYRVAVLGLSVGSNVAFTLAQAGISRRIAIADFDELDTTNLNRIFAGVHQIGLNKTTVAARRIYEDNPFAEVTALAQGIDPASLEKLLADGVECIIDEVDDMRFKIEARKIAMSRKTPVVMVTDNGDGVVLHVERYDLGCTTIFGKEPAYFDQHLSRPLGREDAGRIIMQDIVGGADRVDPAMLASVQRVLAKELVSWSQLGSAALLAGVVATYMIKHIALGKSTAPDIRAYISPAGVFWSTHTA